MALAFAIAYFILFASYTTPPNSRDGKLAFLSSCASTIPC
jgi:hypothetical protein